MLLVRRFLAWRQTTNDWPTRPGTKESMKKEENYSQFMSLPKKAWFLAKFGIYLLRKKFKLICRSNFYPAAWASYGLSALGRLGQVGW